MGSEQTPVAEFVILGRTPSKKNSHEWRYSRKRRRAIITPSVKYQQWEEVSALQLMNQNRGNAPITERIQLEVHIYNTAPLGDLSNLTQSLEDCLQRARVIEDDKLVESLDGSRKHQVKHRTEERAVIKIYLMED